MDGKIKNIMKNEQPRSKLFENIKRDYWWLSICAGIIALILSGIYFIGTLPDSDIPSEQINYSTVYIFTSIPTMIGLMLIVIGIRLKFTE
ncbi:MAG: hypothetical protein HZB92_00815 [Euryarchaeota archaeon]|nr:hypothetical protein [Euryarchaeota archaeon]